MQCLPRWSRPCAAIPLILLTLLAPFLIGQNLIGQNNGEVPEANMNLLHGVG